MLNKTVSLADDHTYTVFVLRPGLRPGFRDKNLKDYTYYAWRARRNFTMREGDATFSAISLLLRITKQTSKISSETARKKLAKTSRTRAKKYNKIYAFI